MSFGIIEVITLLLGLAGFGLSANPKAPTADQALAYALPDADITAHVDAASIIPANYKLLGQLAEQPQIKASPELAKVVRQAVGEVEGARGVAKLATGIDVATDIADATAFFRIVPGADPVFVVAVHGKFSPANLDKIAKAAGKTAQKLGSGTIVDGQARDPAIGLTRDGVLLVGTPDLVRDRLADGWRPPAHDAGTSLGPVAEVISARPVFAMVLTMSPQARTEALSHLGARSFATDVITRHKAAAFAMYHDGIGWTWIDTAAGGVDNMELVSRGVLDVLRAAQIAPRGIAQIAMGAIDSYRGTSAQVDDLIKHKADIMKIVTSYTGDGNFKVAIKKDARAMRLDVRATGKSVSEVLPFGLVLPAAVVGFMTARAEAAESGSGMAEPARPAPLAKPPATRPAPPVARPPAPARPPASTPRPPGKKP
ncbi:MAG TPA: hypothetical protein VFT22_31925 [Kofleriaceae bacterium]|nr:hypothetical protein [Kofleriaceae bacterium]